MSRTYKAVQTTQPGKLELVEKPIVEPAFGQVRIRVEACGVCHSDALTVEGGFPGLTYPRVPGHEVIGKIEAIGPGVQGWKEGQRVGVGFMGGHCGHCENCRRGDFVNCQNQPISGVHSDGGYAEMMIAQASGLAAIPDDLIPTEAAPLASESCWSLGNNDADHWRRAGDIRYKTTASSRRPVDVPG